MEARINNDCVNYINKVVMDATGECEIGGILLGTRADKKIVVLEVVEISSITDSTYSYSLDGDLATEIANASNLEFVGIWHSHINSCEHFSTADEKVNVELAGIFGGIISVLVVSDKNEPLKVFAYLIDEDGETKRCLQTSSSI